MIYQLVDILAAVAIALLGLIVYRKNPVSKINKAFFWLALGCFFWVVTLSLFYLIDQPFWVNVLGRLNFAASIMMAAFIYIFACLFPHDTKNTDAPWQKPVLFVTSAFSVLTIFTPLVDAQEVANGAERITHYGPLYVVYILLFGGLLFISTVIMACRYRHSQGLERIQQRLLFLGIFLAAIFGSITNIFAPFFFGNYDAQQLGPVAIIFFVAMTTYTILKHRFLDIRLAVRATLSQLILASLWTVMICLGVLLYSQIYFVQLNWVLVGTLAFGVSVLLALSYKAVNTTLTRLFSSLLFQGDYDSHELVSRLTKSLSRSIALPILTETLENALKEAFKPSFARVLLTVNSGAVPAVLQTALLKTNSALVLDELLLEDDQVAAAQIAALRELKAEVVLSLSSKDVFLGILALGEKKSNEAYTTRDISTLETISYAAGVALENAYLYQESLNFNQTLKEEVQKATDDLQTAYNRLQESDRAKDEFVSVVSHELRTPMTIIKNYLWMLGTDKGGVISDTKKQYIDKANRGVERMLNLVNDMLDAGKIDQSTLPLAVKPVDVKKLIVDVTEEFKIKTTQKRIYLNFEDTLRARPSVLVLADDNKLREVLTNLLGNAIKFTDWGGIVVKLEKDGNLVKVSVLDTGGGIAPENLPKLFHKFSRVGSSYTTVAEAGGSGLGLYIAKTLVERMGGQIGVESKLGVGSTFWFELPAANL